MSTIGGTANERCLLNFRDTASAVTGLAATGRGRLFRGSSPDVLRDQELRDLARRHHLHAVLDLRVTADHAYRQRLARHGLAYRHAPVLDVGAFSRCSLEADYVARLDHDPGLPRAIRSVADALARPVLIHCTAGKDRTGVVVAVTLALAGWPREAILADYLATGRDLAALRRGRHARGTSSRAGTLPSAMFECRPEPLLVLLDGLRDRGGAAGWARDAGVPGASVAAIRARLRPPDGDGAGARPAIGP